MRKVNTIPEIKAELLLNNLYPEAGSQWSVQNEGIFYRNYNSDLLSIDEEKMEAQTARDSYIKLLPQGMLTRETDLKGEDSSEKFKQLQRRLRFLRETFKPIDSLHFRDSLYIEQQTDKLLQDKIPYILENYFGIDLNQIENHYVREAALLLPFVSRRRGDFGFIASLLRVLFKCKVVMTSGRYSHTDNTKNWLPMIRYELQIPGLSAEEYRKMDTDLEPLREFLQEWFLHVEVWCKIDIKEKLQEPGMTNTRLILDYNTEL